MIKTKNNKQECPYSMVDDNTEIRLCLNEGGWSKNNNNSLSNVKICNIRVVMLVYTTKYVK